MVAWRFAPLWLALIAPAVAAPPRDAGTDLAYQVLADSELVVEPEDSAYATGMVRRGERVAVVALQPDWAQVRAPATNFHWIDAADVEQAADGRCVVSRRQATIRYAAASARLPGPPLRSVRRGTTVQLLDHPPLKVAGSGSAQVWQAIAASDDAYRYVRREALTPWPPPGGNAESAPATPPPAERPERTVAYQAEADAANLPPEVNAELASIAAMTRTVQASSVESWNLEPVRGRYESLLRQFGSNPAVTAVVEPRLAQVRRDLDLASAAQTVARLLREGDQRDAVIGQLQHSVTTARARTERGYDAQGFLQPSSRLSQGQKVLALIGPEGRPISYLSIAPGVPVKQFLARKVGVRGAVHFDEELGARLISVRDLELLDRSR